MIPLAVPNLGPREAEYAASAIASGWVGPDGSFVERFEELVAKASGRQWAVATITGSAALHVAAFVGMLDCRLDVRVWSQAFPAMSNIVKQLGGRGRLMKGGSHHDAALYQITPWHVIADRAPAIGERHTINADMECYSFAANKIVTCGHGGSVVGDDPDLHAAVRREVRQGYYLDGHFNYRMANINAAIGCAQMERLDELKLAKRQIWKRYADAGLPMVERGPSRWMATIEAVQPAERMVEYLEAAGIAARAEPAGVSIPCSTGLTEQDQDKVIEACSALLP